MAKSKSTLNPDAPLLHSDHKRPTSRRDFIRQGFLSGAGAAFFPSVFGLFANPREAMALVAGDVEAMAETCTLGSLSLNKIPFICFDLAGGANIAGSNVLVGKSGGQMDFLSASGYRTLGLPDDMLPNDPAFVNNELGLAFHSDSAFLRGILEKLSVTNRARVNGAVLPARSDNDTANNPHNPMYGIARYALANTSEETGLNFDINNPAPWGQLMSLIGSRASDSGGNSMTRADLMVPEIRPTKVDRPSDSTGLVNTGSLTELLDPADAPRVLETMARISEEKLDSVSLGSTTEDLIRCGYVRAADISATFTDQSALDPLQDEDITGGGSPIFTTQEMQNDGEFAKTASIMKLVIEGRAGAGCITMGGFDYHTGDRATGEVRDLRAGRCMGACLEYAARKNVPLMMYVFSDGSVSSNGSTDTLAEGRGKLVWSSDSSATAASFFLIFNPNGAITLRGNDLSKQQIGHMREDASVETSSRPSANNVNLLVETIMLNYMALHGQEGQFPTLFPTNGLGSTPEALDPLISFGQIL